MIYTAGMAQRAWAAYAEEHGMGTEAHGWSTAETHEWAAAEIAAAVEVGEMGGISDIMLAWVVGCEDRQEPIPTAVRMLIDTWTETYDGMADDGEQESFDDSIQSQIDGYLDMSAEDMTDELAAVLGWTLPMTDDQADRWMRIVLIAARIWAAC